MSVKQSDLTAKVRESLSPGELEEVRRIVTAHGETYDSLVDVIADAREMLRASGKGK